MRACAPEAPRDECSSRFGAAGAVSDAVFRLFRCPFHTQLLRFSSVQFSYLSSHTPRTTAEHARDLNTEPYSAPRVSYSTHGAHARTCSVVQITLTTLRSSCTYGNENRITSSRNWPSLGGGLWLPVTLCTTRGRASTSGSSRSWTPQKYPWKQTVGAGKRH
jgi:hypothetical protein